MPDEPRRSLSGGFTPLSATRRLFTRALASAGIVMLSGATADLISARKKKKKKKKTPPPTCAAGEITCEPGSIAACCPADQFCCNTSRAGCCSPR